ncbi:glycosyltransferase [Romboutsia sp. Marseille-P6047]|uniref:glycosyltransferase n=1 Tax=Romboutsia sp. Marseille-P6047 TaxID=2161817 RepID=UPI000F06D93A|nr:glycosyltransferase [Romboutsia sp. Marseille-P6047]
MYIAFYISSHGFGHMTRCLSIIENILSVTDYKIYIACDKPQNGFARSYLEKYKERIIYRDIKTDVGLVNKNDSLEVDKDKLEEELMNFIKTWDEVVLDEIKTLKNLKVKSIITDISPIGCLVGKILELETILISNFTWVEQYEYLNIDKNIISFFRGAYSYVNKLIKYDLCLPIDSVVCKDIEDVGFICRKINKSKVADIQSKYGESIFITCGKSANLKSINIENFNGTIFTTSGIDINNTEGADIIRLPLDVKDTQNYIAASSLVITKAGWGTIGECLIGHTPMVLIERDSAREDSFSIDNIKKRKLGISMKEDTLGTIDILKIKEQLRNNIDYKKLGEYTNDIDKVVHLIINNK